MTDDSMWQSMRRMQRRFDRLFGNFGTVGFGRRFDSESGVYRKAWADFKENEEEFVLEIELPGVEKEDISLDVTETGIEIKAERKQEMKKEDKEKGEYSFSRSYAGFARYVDLPEESDLEKIDAEYNNGVLSIRVPKKEIKVKKGKEVEIR